MLITYDRNCQQCSLLCLRDQYYRTRETLVLQDQGGTGITGPGGTGIAGPGRGEEATVLKLLL